VYIFRAAYTDRGANGLPGVASEETFTLRSASINPSKYDEVVEATKMSFGGNNFVIATTSGSYISLKQIDLTAITSIDITALAPKAQLNAEGGVIELHIDAPDGKLLGQGAEDADLPEGNDRTAEPRQRAVLQEHLHQRVAVAYAKESGLGPVLCVVIVPRSGYFTGWSKRATNVRSRSLCLSMEIERNWRIDAAESPPNGA